MKNKKGFTLIEMVLVVLIVGILAAAFLQIMFGATNKARDTQRVSDVQKIASILTTSLAAQTATGGCVDLEKGSDLQGNLKSSDFSGRKIKDPFDMQITTGCEGYYVVKNNNNSPIYSFAIISKLEVLNDKGNIACPSNLAPSMDLNLPEWTIVAPSSTTNCYAVLVQ